MVTAKGVLVLSRGARGFDEDVERRLRAAFPDYRTHAFNGTLKFLRGLAKGAPVIVAGGDGTIGYVAGKLVDRDHPLGIVPIGTFNNFSRALKVPEELDAAIEAIREGRPRPVTVGRVNGRPFLEVAAAGLFGRAIALGEAAKDRTFGELREHLRGLGGSRPFRYRLEGDLEGEGQAYSLVFANTPSTGAQLAVASGTPEDAFLELSVHAGSSPADMIGRVLASSVLQRHSEAPEAVFRFRKLQVTTKPSAPIFADGARAGRTPTRVEADVGALRVILRRT